MPNKNIETGTRQQKPYFPDPSKSQSAYRVDVEKTAFEVIHTRQNISPRRLVEPGPTEEQLSKLFQAAAAAPDHGTLLPWRFIMIPADKRHLLAEAFAVTLIERDPGATVAQLETAREKAYRAPALMVAIVKLAGEDAAIPNEERIISIGCAIQNILLAATAMGLGSGLASGRSMNAPRLRELFKFQEGEQAICFVSLGTVASAKPLRCRPLREGFVSSL